MVGRFFKGLFGGGGDSLERESEAVSQDFPEQVERVTKAIGYMGAGDFEPAISEFDAVIEMNPADWTSFQNRGSAYLQLERFDKAVADFSESIRLNPNNTIGYVNRGRAYAAARQFRRAEADYNRAIESGSTLPPEATAVVYLDRGLLYQSVGQPGKAMLDFSKAIDLDENLSEAYSRRGLMYLVSGNQEEAWDDFVKAVKLNPLDGSARGNMGMILINNGFHNKGIELDPEDAVAYKGRAVVHRHLGNIQQSDHDAGMAVSNGYPESQMTGILDEIS